MLTWPATEIAELKAEVARLRAERDEAREALLKILTLAEDGIAPLGLPLWPAVVAAKEWEAGHG